MSKNEKQQEKIANLLKLISENPDLEIMPMVDNEICNDDYSRSLGMWGNAEIDYYYCKDERIYFKSDDFDELVEDEIEKLVDAEEKYLAGYGVIYDELDEEKFTNEAEIIVEALPWVKAIIVNIDTF